MAIRSKDEILEAFRGRMGEEPDDETIAFLEDITDTFSDLETRAKDSTDWKSKYEENDKEWRTKYTERFFSEQPTQEPTPEPTPEPNIPMTFDDLFKEED